MKTCLTFLFIIVVNVKVWSQIGSFGISTTYNSYFLTDVKKFFSQIKGDIVMPAKIVDNFPPVLGIKAVYSRDFFFTNLNLYIGYNSTGSRISYADYSGKINVDMIANIYSAGIQGNLPVHSNEFFSLFFSPNLSVAYVQFKIKSEFQLLDQKESDKISLESKTLGGGLGLTFEKKIKFLTLRGEIGAEIYVPTKITFPDYEDFVLVNKSQKPVKCELWGLRSGIGILYNFDYRK